MPRSRRFGKAVDDGDRSHLPPYEEAALQLMLGNRDVALELFDKAIDAGALEGEFPKIDPLMADIRHEPRFVESFARIERDWPRCGSAWRFHRYA